MNFNSEDISKIRDLVLNEIKNIRNNIISVKNPDAKQNLEKELIKNEILYHKIDKWFCNTEWNEL